MCRLIDSDRCCRLHEGKRGESFALMTLQSWESGQIASSTQNGPVARVAPHFLPLFIVALATRVFLRPSILLLAQFFLLSFPFNLSELILPFMLSMIRFQCPAIQN